MFRQVKSKKLSILEIFFMSFKLYTHSFLYILAVTIFYNGLILLFRETFPAYLQKAFLDMRFIRNVDTVILYFYLSLFLSLTISALAFGAITYIVLRTLEGRPVTLGGLIESSLLKYKKYLLVALFYTGIVSSLYTFLFFGAVIGIYWMFSVCITALSGRWGFSALAESWVLIKGHFLRMLVVTGLLFLFINACHLLLNYLAYTIQLPDTFFYRLAFGLACEMVNNFIFVVISLCFFNISFIKMLTHKQKGA